MSNVIPIGRPWNPPPAQPIRIERRHFDPARLILPGICAIMGLVVAAGLRYCFGSHLWLFGVPILYAWMGAIFNQAD